MDTVNSGPGADDIPGRPTIADVIEMCRARARGEATPRWTRPTAPRHQANIPVISAPPTTTPDIPVTFAPEIASATEPEPTRQANIPVTSEPRSAHPNIPVTSATTVEQPPADTVARDTYADPNIPVTPTTTDARTPARDHYAHANIPVTPEGRPGRPDIPAPSDRPDVHATDETVSAPINQPNIPVTSHATTTRLLLPKTSPPPSGELSLGRGAVSGNTSVGLASRLIRLLNHPMAKIVTTLQPSLVGDLIEINRDLVEQHLNGDLALTFCVLEGERSTGFASFVGFDYDVYAPHRIEVTARILAEIDPALTLAAFSTDGSDPNTRGKLIITLDEPIPPRVAYAFAREIRRRCMQQPDFGHVRAADFDTRPTNLKGGLLRIGGRNILRGSRYIESFYSADGRHGSDLSEVVPIARARIEEITAALTGTSVVPMSWVRAWEHQPWTYEAMSPPNTQGVVSRVCAIARAYAEQYGPKGEERFYRLIERIADNSPALNRPSPKNRDPKNTLRDKKYLQQTWKFALASPSDWKPKTIVGSGLPARVITAYAKLAEYQHPRGFQPRCFTMDCGRVAEMLGVSKMTAHRHIRDLETYGLLVKHHPGRPMTSVPGGTLRGLSAIVGLIGDGETEEHLRDFVRRDRNAIKMLSQRGADMLAPPIPRKMQAEQRVG
jgi:hypothetical protein